MSVDKFYTVDLNKTEWTLPHKYKNPLPIGSGAYGQVWLVRLSPKLSLYWAQ